MGCVSSKQGVSKTPGFDYPGSFRQNGSVVTASSLGNRAGLGELEKEKVGLGSKREKSNFGDYLSLRLDNLQKYVEGAQAAAGWPAWLSAVAGEAIQGWVPLRMDNFEKLEKIGQGTYSSVFRARDLESGRIVALKKVRFDNFEPESVRFMAREIMILRRLDHPNIIKLEGLITSQLSCSIYLVFEYMEHDLSGLSSCPDIKFSEPQVKCYMQQLLSALEHCHSKGVMHRDIKGSNLLVNNEGILKVADFGLANSIRSRRRHPLTSRVVTLWYRPPELLLGSTDYGAYVDLWSVGCVFAELINGKPILKGRTEVEQLHKIFKLCGSPPDDYWKKSKLPHAPTFKPQHPYESSLRETCKEFPTAALNLLETFLSVEPYKRGSASSALASKYFATEPYACDPSSLPKYLPNKEIDTKSREAQRIKLLLQEKVWWRVRTHGETRKPTRICRAVREPNGISNLVPTEDLQFDTRGAHKIHGNGHISKESADDRLCGETPKPSMDMAQKASRIKNESQGDVPFSGPLKVTTSTGFAWVNGRKEDAASISSCSRSSSRGRVSSALDPSMANSKKRDTDVLHGGHNDSGDHDSCEINKRTIMKQWSRFECPDSFDASDTYHSQELSRALYQREKTASKINNGDGDIVEFSGPLLSQSHGIEELLKRREHRIREVVRRSWFRRGNSSSRATLLDTNKVKLQWQGKDTENSL